MASKVRRYASNTGESVKHKGRSTRKRYPAIKGDRWSRLLTTRTGAFEGGKKSFETPERLHAHLVGGEMGINAKKGALGTALYRSGRSVNGQGMTGRDRRPCRGERDRGFLKIGLSKLFPCCEKCCGADRRGIKRKDRGRGGGIHLWRRCHRYC